MTSNLETYLSSSPDPLAVSPFSVKGIKPLPKRSSSAWKRISQHGDYGSRDRTSRSPSKTVAFTTPAEPGSSPWKIKVTVQAEPRGAEKENNKTLKFQSVRGERTQRVPLKGEDESSPAKRRGRPRKSAGSPANRKSSLTPARRRSASSKKITENQDNTEEDGHNRVGKARNGASRRSKRINPEDEEQVDRNYMHRSISTDELTNGATVFSGVRADRLLNFGSLTPLHERYPQVAQKKASSPTTPEGTMKSVKGRQCTPVKPNGWSEDQPSSISSASSSEIAHGNDLDFPVSHKENVQYSCEDDVNGGRSNVRLDTGTLQDRTLNLRNFISPPVRHHIDDDTQGQELETMLADGDNQSILNCEDFSIVSVDSLPSRREAPSWDGDKSACDTPATPGIESIIANFRIDETIGEEQISKKNTPKVASDAEGSRIISSKEDVQHDHHEQELKGRNVSSELSMADEILDDCSVDASEVSALGSATSREAEDAATVPNRSSDSPSRGLMARLGGLFKRNCVEEKTKSPPTKPEKAYDSDVDADDDFISSSLEQPENKDTRTPKDNRLDHGNSIQLPTPDDRADSSTKGMDSSYNIGYPNLDKSIHLTQTMSPVSLPENESTVALDECSITTTNNTYMNTQSPSDQLLETKRQEQSSSSPDILQNTEVERRSSGTTVDRREDNMTVNCTPKGDWYEPRPKSISKTEGLHSPNSGNSPTEQIEYDVSGIVETFQKELPESTQTRSSSAVKFREEVIVINNSDALEQDELHSEGSDNFSGSDHPQEDFEGTDSNDIEDSILQEQLRPVPLHYKTSPLHLSRRNMYYVLGLKNPTETSSEHENQAQFHNRSIKSSPPILRPCRKLEDRQDRSFQTLQDTDIMAVDQSTIASDESMHSDMKQLMKEMNQDILQSEESCIDDECDASSIPYESSSLTSEEIHKSKITSSSDSQSQVIECRSRLTGENNSLDISIAGSGVLSRIWNSLTFNNQPADPSLVKYRPLPKLEPWTKTHYKVMDRMYQSLKRSPQEFSMNNPTNPPLPRPFKSEISTKMANWGYSVTFTPEHMVLAARFYRLLSLEETDTGDIELGDCCPGPAGKRIDEQTVCLRLFSIIVGEDIRRDERAGIRIDRSSRNVSVTKA